VAAVCEPVEESSGHLGVAEDSGPFTEAEIGGDDHTRALVELAEEMEQQRAARGAERQVAQFIEDHEVELGQVLGNLACLALGLLLFEGVDQFDRREEADLSTMMLDRLDADMLVAEDPACAPIFERLEAELDAAAKEERRLSEAQQRARALLAQKAMRATSSAICSSDAPLPYRSRSSR
jgi:hypothetical protein